MHRIKKYFFILLLLELLFSYSPALAATADYRTAGVSAQIKQYLCAPTDVKPDQTKATSGASNYLNQPALQKDAATNNANEQDLYKCINQLYKFAIALSVTIGVFFIVIAGYIYMSADGNEESVDKAKNILTTTITSLVILFSAYLLLKTINPDIIQFQSIQPCSVTDCNLLPPAAAPGSGTGKPGSGSITGGVCQPAASGVASVSVLQQGCFGTHANYASMIANKESGGNPALPSGVDLCKDSAGNLVKLNGKNVSVSLGLFQINISAHPIAGLNCPSAFSAMYTASNHICSVTNEALYNQCVSAALDATTNIQTACQISSNGQNWSAWVNECGPQ